MDEKSKEKLKAVHPELARKVELLINDLWKSGEDVRIVQGLRTFAEQDALYAQGLACQNLNILPNFSLDIFFHVRRRNVKLLRQRISGNALIGKISDLTYLAFCQFRTMIAMVFEWVCRIMAFPSRQQVVFSRVAAVFQNRYILQIVSEIVQFVTVFMVHDAPVKGRPKKGKSNKFVNFERSSFAVKREIQTKISVRCEAGSHYMTRSTCSVGFGSFNAPQTGGGVAIATIRDVFPNFNGIIFISHSVFSYLENGLIRLAEDVQNLWRAVSILPQTTFQTKNLGVIL